MGNYFLFYNIIFWRIAGKKLGTIGIAKFPERKKKKYLEIFLLNLFGRSLGGTGSLRGSEMPGGLKIFGVPGCPQFKVTH